MSKKTILRLALLCVTGAVLVTAIRLLACAPPDTSTPTLAVGVTGCGGTLYSNTPPLASGGAVCKGAGLTVSASLSCNPPVASITITATGAPLGTSSPQTVTVDGTSASLGLSTSAKGTISISVSAAGTDANGHAFSLGDTTSITVFQMNAVSPTTAVICKNGSAGFSATTDPTGYESTIAWEATNGTFSPTTGGASVTWTPQTDFVSTTVNDVTITAKCGCGSSAVTATATVVSGTIKVKRQGTSTDEFSTSATVAAGGPTYTTPVHKADVEITATPAIAGVCFTIKMTNDKGETGTNGDAAVTAPGSTNSSGKASATFTSSNISHRTVTLTLYGPNDTSLGSSATVLQEWEGGGFSVPPYFIPEVPDTCTFKCQLSATVPIDGHGSSLAYENRKVKVEWYEWDMVTGEENGNVEELTAPFSNVPFTGVGDTDFVTQGPTTESTGGIYSNTQTVHDYFDIVDDVWQEAWVLEYQFGMCDMHVYDGTGL